MARNGSGTYSRVAGTPYVYNTVIDQVVVNAELDDIATALTASIAKDGQTTPTANLPMGTYRHTGVGNAVARTDYPSAGQVQDSSLIWGGTGGGTADAITLTPSPAITAYTAGQTFRFTSSGANTGAATVNISSLGAQAIKKDGTTALAAGDIPSGALIEITYDGTNFQLVRNGAANRGANSDITQLTGLTGETTMKAAARLGYGTGAGGTVTQSTSKSTAVTLNTPSGQITMNNAALAGGASVIFKVNNSLVDAAAGDVVIVNNYFNSSYRAECITLSSGTGFYIMLTNLSGGSLSDAVVINFAVIKGSIS